MDIKTLFQELKRRNIYKVAVAYGITGWIIIQIATNVFPMLEFPQWTSQFVIILVLIGFPIALVFAWAFEITPEGLKRTRDVPEEHSITHHTGRKLYYWIIGLLSLAVILLVVERIWFAGTYTDANKPPSTEQKASVAVLPFEDYSPKGDQQWFADGLTEEILGSLARLKELRVPGRTSSFVFRGTDIPIPEIADSLHVNHVLEGSVRRVKDEMRITVQLIRAEDESHLWSKTYNRSVNDVFKVQEDIATQVVQALDIYLDEEERRRMVAYGTRNVRAYEAYLKGLNIYRQAHLKGPYSRLWYANRWFERAWRRDSTFAAPYYGHHDVYAHLLLGYLDKPADSVDRETAYRRMHADLDNAIHYATGHGERLFYQSEKVFLSKSWKQFPNLQAQIRNKLEAYSTTFAQNIGWAIATLPVMGYASTTHKILWLQRKQDPLNYILKNTDARALLILGKKEEARKIYRRFSQSPTSLRALMHVIAGQQKKVHTRTQLQKLESTDSSTLLGWKLLYGLKKMTKKEVAAYVNKKDTNKESVFLYFAAGYPKKANSLAHHIDSSILGPQRLSMLIWSIGNYIPFDLEATPKLVRRFEEAGVETKPDTLAGREVRRIVQKERP